MTREIGFAGGCSDVRCVAAACVCTIVALAGAPAAAQTGSALCFPPHVGLPYDYAPPTIDGYVEPELARPLRADLPVQIEKGWTLASRLTYGGGTGSDPLLAVQALKNRNPGQDYVYLNFMVHDDPSFDDDDAIVLVFRPKYWQTPPSPGVPGVPISTKSTDERRIDIEPVHTWGAGNEGTSDPNDDLPNLRTNRRPKLTTYYKWTSSGWTQIDNATLTQPEFTDNIKVRSWDAGTNTKNWFVEIRLPTSKAKGGPGWIDLDTHFGFYFNVIRACTTAECKTPVFQAMATEFTFPRADYATGGRLMADPNRMREQFPIDPDWFGEGILGSSSADCRGVRFASGHSSIGTTANPADLNAPLSTAMTTAGKNMFAARVTNDGSAAATNVTAEFRVAGWGSQNPEVGYWDLIPATSGTNPTAPMSIVPAGTAQFTVEWDPTAQPTKPPWFDQLGRHNCVAVRLTSKDDVYFTESQQWNNLNFANLSSYQEQVTIRANGYGPSGSGSENQDFLLVSSSKTLTSTKDYSGWSGGKPATRNVGDPAALRQFEADVLRSGVEGYQARATAAAAPPLDPAHGQLIGQIVAAWIRAARTAWTIVWDVNAYRTTPFEYRGSNGRLYRLGQATTSFGVVGTHVGDVLSMGGELVTPVGTDRGGTLRSAGKQAWRVEVPDGGSRVVDVTVVAVEPKAHSIALRAGFAASIGQYRETYDPSLGLELDYEYRINPVAAIGASFRRDVFKGLVGEQDVTAWSASAEARLYAFKSPIRAFLPFGIGVYVQDPGEARLGAHVGFGGQWDITPRLAAELAATFRGAAKGKPGAWSEAGLGVRYRF